MTPRVQAILIAENVYEDRTTGKKVVAGIFDRLKLVNPEDLKRRLAERHKESGINVVPGGMQVGSPTCFIRLTGVRGEKDFTLRYVYVNEDEVLLQTKFQVKCDDPLQTIDVVLPLPPLPGGRFGAFVVELVCNGNVIGSHRITVEQLSLPEENSDDAH